MPWNESLYLWLIHSAVVSLLVLAVGSGAVLLCRRPARRVWIIELTLAGCLIAPWPGAIPDYPRLGFGWSASTSLNRKEAALPPSAGKGEEAPTLPTVLPPFGDLPVSPQTVAAEPVPTTADAPSDPFDLASWIVTAYAIGVALGLAWWLVGLLGLVKFMRTTWPAPSRCQELLAQIAGERARRVKVLVGRSVRQPFAFAFGRPVIVLPEDLCGDDRALRWSLAHEWTHIERHDLRAWLLAGLTRALFFYHPLVWWLRYQLRLCQDFLADDRAACQTPQPEDYAEFLMTRAAARSMGLAAVGLGIGARRSELYRRVVMLVQNRPMEGRAPRLWTTLVTCAAFVLVSTAAAVSIGPQGAGQEQLAAAQTNEKTDNGSETGQSRAPKPEASTETVRGKVIDDSDKPVDGAEVFYPGGSGWRVRHSDSQGRFVVEVPSAQLAESRPADRALLLWAYAVGHRIGASKVMLPTDGSDVVVRLGPATDTSFLILDSEGRPCEGVLVEPFTTRISRGYPFLPGELTARVRARTNSEGRVKLPGVPRDGLNAVWLRSKAHGDWRQDLGSLGETIPPETTIQLPPTGRVEGRVIADDPKVVRGVAIDLSTQGEPYANQTLRLNRGGDSGDARSVQASASAHVSAYGSVASAYVVSDDEGRFVVPAIAVGRGMAMVHTEKDSQYGAKLALFSVASPGPTRIEIRMMSTVRVVGVARAEGTGHPVAGVPLFVNGYFTSTDAQGKFTAAVLPGDASISVVDRDPNGWTLSADGAGKTFPDSGNHIRKVFSVPEGVKQFDIPSLQLTPPAQPETGLKTVRGKVIDEDGKPVDGADVWLTLFLRGVGQIHTLHVRSDDQGQFALEVTPDWLGKMQPWDRAMTVWAYTADRQLGTGRVALPESASDVVIRLGPAADTSFVVLDPEGQPFAGALVEPFYIRTWQAIQFPPDELLARVSARTDAEGRVKLPAVASDLLYQVRVTSKNFGVQMQRTIEAPGQPIRLRQVGKIEGRLIAEPEIVRGVRFAFSSQEHRDRPGPWPAKEWPAEGFAEVESDEQGRFVVPTIAEGDVRIDAFVNETQPLRPKLPASVSVQANRTTVLEIPMVPTVVVRGSVRVKDTGKPVPGAMIHISYGVGRQGAEGVSDAQGNYTARVLPGNIRVQVIAMPTGHVWLQGAAFPFPSYQVPEDASQFDLPPIEVVPTKSIAGRVVHQQGQPLADIWISVVDGDRHYGRGKSDKNGQFEVVGVPVTIDPAKVKYVWLPEVGPGRPFVSTMPSQCEVLKTDPLTLRALPRDPRMDLP